MSKESYMNAVSNGHYAGLGKDKFPQYPKITNVSGGYCTIPVLYDRIAIALGLDTDKAHYDCTKVEVSCHLQEEVFSYYKMQNIKSETYAMWWLNYGPKTADDLKDNEARVHDGWYLPEKK